MAPCVRIPGVFIVTIFVQLAAVQAGLKVGFYQKTCPKAEGIIRNTVQQAFYKNRGIAPGLLRMHFHDCFVEGCDGSVLIDGSGAEKNSPPNLSLRGFEVIDAAKSRLEAACPGIVSCADTLAFAARDSVLLTGGLPWNVPAGRRDGTVSLSSRPIQFLPPPSADVALLTQTFAAQGLSKDEMVTLSGSHTIGASHCVSFTNRLYNFNSTFPVDPTLNLGFAKKLQQLCPQANANPNKLVPMDSFSSNTFDNAYFTNLRNWKGLFTSDEVLFTDSSTTSAVIQNSKFGHQWQYKFTQAMIKMGSIGVKTGTQGQIRKNCRVINS